MVVNQENGRSRKATKYWSARKAQMLARAYKERGGGYKGEKTEGQKSLKRWGEQKWMTKSEYEKNK